MRTVTVTILLTLLSLPLWDTLTSAQNAPQSGELAQRVQDLEGELRAAQRDLKTAQERALTKDELALRVENSIAEAVKQALTSAAAKGCKRGGGKRFALLFVNGTAQPLCELDLHSTPAR